MTTSASGQMIDDIRAFNRFYTRHLGVLEDGYLQSEFTLTQARIVYELGTSEGMTASDLQAELGHNAGYLSRVLRGLREDGLIAMAPSPVDGRERLLSLTAAGRDAFTRLDTRSNDLIAADLEPIGSSDRERLVSSMRTIRQLLEPGDRVDGEIRIRTHQPGDMGWIVQAHGELYTRERGWSAAFEAEVAGICAHFLQAFDPARDRCWIAERNGEQVGSVMLVHHPEREGVAKLRLLLVHPDARGQGLGRQLVDTCTAFAREAGYRTITLWTMQVLTSARHIYRTAGYRLLAQEPHTGFSPGLISETWELDLQG